MDFFYQNNGRRESIYKERLITVQSVFFFWKLQRDFHRQWYLKCVKFLRDTTDWKIIKSINFQNLLQKKRKEKYKKFYFNKNIHRCSSNNFCPSWSPDKGLINPKRFNVDFTIIINSSHLEYFVFLFSSYCRIYFHNLLLYIYIYIYIDVCGTNSSVKHMNHWIADTDNLLRVTKAWVGLALVFGWVENGAPMCHRFSWTTILRFWIQSVSFS